MLISLHIQNFALIEKAQLVFQPGFTVITGETGSGKSILLGALNLILGERADYGVIRDKSAKTFVEAHFSIGGFGLEAFFAVNDLDFAEETIIRREISAQGKSRAFVNDSPVQLNILKELAEKLIHIHSQHHTIELKNPEFQLDLLDVLANNALQKDTFKLLFQQWKKKETELKNKKAALAKLRADSDYNNFQLEELTALKLDVLNYEAMEQQLIAIERLDDVKSGFATIANVIEDERGINDLLAVLKSSTEKIQHLHPQLTALLERISAARIELMDIAEEATQQLESLDSDPMLLNDLTEKLDLYNRALRKHQVTTQSELNALAETLHNSQESTDQLQFEIEALEKEVVDLQNQVDTQANQLHKKRITAAPIVANQLVTVLNELKLNNSIVRFEMEQTGKMDFSGNTKLALLFSPNAGMTEKPIEKTASGGELSRFMLALQLLLSAKKKLPAVIFDEIDTGVSGEVAQKIGLVLKKMGHQMQVLAITHLPQVAGQGMHHWKVEKNNQNGNTLTRVAVLDDSQRVEEIARLMSGENINEAALENARALMN
ncbi:MAG: DNA repair protein RecN [Crocinitomicaceae bacterium]|nr:MAG: DNA repair protein RecN [Crocinitomicaceae bacterium]